MKSYLLLSALAATAALFGTTAQAQSTAMSLGGGAKQRRGGGQGGQEEVRLHRGLLGLVEAMK